MHSDWGTPGGVHHWYADRFEETDADRSALWRALALGVAAAAALGAAAMIGVGF